ncbi:MAG: hypothetical protein B6244_05710 [Candidatus Cloacimonetes bacterium 4572_55]|nr:MAG: hypothetical protein B6244_05710 [Candidatus Cloacimonetes bacterium 4572_55]
MAAELKKAVGADVKLIKGSGGAFEVQLDSQMIFSKSRLGRFPGPGEVVNLIEAKT